MLMRLQDTVAVHHHTVEVEAEAIAAVTEVAVTAIHLDLEDSLPGGRRYWWKTSAPSLKQTWEILFLHDPVLARGCSARLHHETSYISRDSI